MLRHRIRTLGIRLLAFSSIAIASGLAVLTFTGGPASAQTTTSCPVLKATADLSTGAVSGGLSRCGDKAVTGGGGTFTTTTAFTSGTIAWNVAGNTSVLTGSLFVLGLCGKGGAGNEFLVSGTVTGGNTFVGETFSATICAVPNKAGNVTVSLVKGTGGFVI